MDVQPRLLDHPFYQAWTEGKVSREQLAAYHRSYAEFIRRIPAYWQKVVEAFQQDTPRGSGIVHDEKEHIDLWELWGKELNPPIVIPDMQEVTDAFESMTPSTLLGALQAFEIQQPEVARTKKEGLLRHYGCRKEDLLYFDAHQQEEKHIAYGSWLADNFADRKEFNEGLTRGASLVYNSLDRFVAA